MADEPRDRDGWAFDLCGVAVSAALDTALLPGGPEARRPSPAVSFEDIYELNFDYVLASLRRLGVHERDLEDVAHDLFVTLYRKLDQYDPSRPIKPWLFGFAVRVASDYRELARNKREVFDSNVPDVDPAASPEEDAAVRHAQALVVKALHAIKPGRREVFILHEIDEVPVAQVAEVLGVPLFTVYDRLKTARAEFESALRKIERGGRV